VRVARALDGLPDINVPFEKGEVSFFNVRAMTRVATEENEDFLLMLAEHDTWDVVTVRAFVVNMYMGSIFRIALKICGKKRFDLDFHSGINEQGWTSLAPNSQWNFNARYNQVTLSQFKRADKTDKMKVVYSLAEKRHLNKYSSGLKLTETP